VLYFLQRRQNTGVQLFQRDVDDEEDDDDDDDDDDDIDNDGINFTFHLNDDTVTVAPKHMINQNWVLLDSKSTMNIFSNKKFLKNIYRCDTKQGLRVHSNGRRLPRHPYDRRSSWFRLSVVQQMVPREHPFPCRRPKDLTRNHGYPGGGGHRGPQTQWRQNEIFGKQSRFVLLRC